MKSVITCHYLPHLFCEVCVWSRLKMYFILCLRSTKYYRELSFDVEQCTRQNVFWILFVSDNASRCAEKVGLLLFSFCIVHFRLCHFWVPSMQTAPRAYYRMNAFLLPRTANVRIKCEFSDLIRWLESFSWRSSVASISASQVLTGATKRWWSPAGQQPKIRKRWLNATSCCAESACWNHF